MRYRTNGPEFDFPPFPGPPPVRYVLASTPRCGSNLLARALWHTGVAGFPEDYLADTYVLDYFERWGFTAENADELPASHIRALMKVRTSPNGVFGIKIHAGHLADLETDPHTLLSSPLYVRVERADRLRQAISYTIAEQTGVWIVDGTHLPASRARSEPRYDYEEIGRRLRMLDGDAETWDAYAERYGITPHVVVYEDLVAHYEESVRACLAFLGVDAPQHIPPPGISRQADGTTEEWVERFHRDAGRDVGRDVGRDAGRDVGRDAGFRFPRRR
ncbi:sulfotransferase Stf0 family [Streptomyces yaizuensis]|uniref:Trehalose 2-sulfotransferase n=1 Tax=Streptomyces yaizuensis TaxID=2989713 RepID=A0ABQ5NXF0_9ACTN|nr:sulfotransferase Stf0 family [Streptomyces sp. YSPA8]